MFATHHHDEQKLLKANGSSNLLDSPLLVQCKYLMIKSPGKPARHLLEIETAKISVIIDHLATFKRIIFEATAHLDRNT